MNDAILRKLRKYQIKYSALFIWLFYIKTGFKIINSETVCLHLNCPEKGWAASALSWLDLVLTAPGALRLPLRALQRGSGHGMPAGN